MPKFAEETQNSDKKVISSNVYMLKLGSNSWVVEQSNQ